MADTEEIPVVSPQEATLQQQTGSLANGQAAPGAVMVDTSKGPMPQQQAPQPKTDEEYWSGGGGAAGAESADDAYWGGPAQPPEPAKPKTAAKPQGKTLVDRLTTLGKGAGGFGLDTAQFLNMAGATPAMLVDKVHSLATGAEQTGAQDAYFNHFVDPVVAAKQQTELGPDADFTDKLLHGIGATAAMIGAALATGGGATAPAGAEATMLGRAASGVGQMSAPAAVSGLDTGKRVYEATGDAKAAAVAGATSYTLNALSGAIPMAVGKGIPTRMATGAAIGPVLGEAQRETQNASLPENMQQPFDKEDALAQVVTGSMFGLLPHATPEVREAPQTVMDHAQTAAAAAVRAEGGDNLDQVVAATHVNAVVGGVHDAAQYEGNMQLNLEDEARNQAQQLALETPEQEAARVPAAGFEQAEAAKATEAPAAASLFERREQEQANAKDADYTAAKNQAGDQAIAQAEGAEKGVEGAAKPTLSDTVSPEQLVTFQDLASRRQAEMGTAEPGETPADEKFMPYNEPQGAPEENAVKPTEEPQETTEGTPPLEGAEETPAEPPPTGEGPAPFEPGPEAPAIEQGGGARPQPKDPETGQFRPLTLRERREAALAKRGADFREENPGQGETAKAIFGAKATPKPRLVPEEVRAAVKPLTDRVGTENLQVHDDHTTLPDNIKQDMVTYNHPNPAGAYDRATGTVHVIASAHESPEDVMRTAVHETVGHKGIQSMLGDDFHNTMIDIGRNLPSAGKSWMRDYAEQHGMDLRQKSHLSRVAGEYVAHLAERDVGHPDQENPGVLRRAMDATRAGFRKIGVVREWNDNDVRRLLRMSLNNMESAHARAGQEYKGKGVDFSDKEDHEVERLDPSNPLAQAHKFGRTMEEQANYNPGFIKSRLDWTKAALTGEGKGVDNRLAFIGLRNLPDFLNPDKMPSLQSFVRQHDQMAGRRGRLMEDANNKLMDWSKWGSKNKEGAKDLGEVMHASTMGGVDPSKPFAKRWGDSTDPTKVAHDQMRKELHGQLKKMYNGLDDKGREIYNTIRDHYSAQREATFKGLEQRVTESGADEQSKKQLMSQLRQQYENGRVQAPYFPLQRFGDRWASAKDKDGNTVSFSRFESKAEQGQWMKEMGAKGYKIDGGQKIDAQSQMERIDPKFVQKVMSLAKGVDPDLAHDIWQEYLKAMPEMSMRKHFIARVGRLGYSMDAMRAFAFNSFHGAHQIARLEYGHRLDTTLDSVKTEAQKVTSDAAADPANAPLQKNAEWAPALAREMERRYDWIKNPRSSPLASALTKIGFHWYLGAAPATAFRILSQNPMLAQPMLAKYHGQLGATKELSRASAQWAMSKGDLGDTLRGDERRAFDNAKDMGVFSSTATQNLASGGSGDPITGPMANVTKALGFMFNAMEHHNRMTTYLAGYRLGKQQGMSHDQAVDHATDVTWDSHFDYTNANRPRVLQNDFMKVAGLFKQYSWGVTYRLAREARDMFDKELSPEQNKQARVAFGGLLARGMMFSGVTGLPFSWVASSVIDAVMGDKDQPYDSEAALHAHLTQTMGPTAADSIMTGPIGALTGASLSGGASYNDLWYRPPTRNESAPDTVKDAAIQAFGPIAAIGVNAAQGYQMIKDGAMERGLEHFLPPEGAALAKAGRYSQEGVLNTQNEPVLSRDQIDNKDLFLQSIGFTPQKVADMYAENSALKNVSQAIQQRREALINRLSVVAGMDDTSEMDKAMVSVDQFNETNPGLAIQGKTIISSMRNHFKNQAQAINGVKLPQGLEGLRDTYQGQQ